MTGKLYLAILSVFALSCSNNNIRKPLAKEAIVEYFSSKPLGLKDRYLLEPFVKLEYENKNYRDFLRKLSDLGLLVFDEKKSKLQKDGVDLEVYKITEKGKAYLIEEKRDTSKLVTYVVHSSDLYVDEISDIQMSPDKKEAILRFTIGNRNFTPFWPGNDSTRKHHYIGYMKMIDQKWILDQYQSDMKYIFQN